MRFLTRAVSALALTAISLGLVGVGGLRLYQAATTPEASRKPPARERSYAVDTATLTAAHVSPRIEAYGQVQAWRSLEIRAPAAGPVTDISDNFRDGLFVRKGELLFRIDPEIASRRVVDAKAAVAQAEAELVEARQSVTHAQSEVAAAETQLAVRHGDLSRKSTLFAKRLTPVSTLDEARLAVSAAEQAVTAREQALLTAKSRIEKAEQGAERSRIALADAERGLADTSYRAPFDGRLTDVALTLGRRLSQNEKLASLIDPEALEVSFPVRNADIGALLDPASPQKLLPLTVTARLDVGGRDLMVSGRLDRTAAVAASQTGRTVFAKLDGATALSPGDFVSVAVGLPQLSNVAVVPAESASVDGRVLIVSENDRLAEIKARIVRHQGDELIVADVPFGARYVVRRLPYLSPGIKVKPRQAGEAPVAEANPRGSAPQRTARASGSRGQADGDDERVSLDESRRAALIAHVKGDSSMPEDRRTRLLAELAKPAPLRRVIDRIERRMGRGETRS
ncbi:MAG: efflux RND transporter periplasmic adaptor subunit [Hyphomicrobiaceae bacterium]